MYDQNRPFIESQDFDMKVFDDIKVVAPEEHNELVGRDKPDAHPMSAVTGLEESMETIESNMANLQEEMEALEEKVDEVEIANDEEADDYLFGN